MLQLPKTKYPNTQRTVTGTVNVFSDDVVLNCDTSAGAVTINLAEIPYYTTTGEGYWSTQYKLYINDISNNAGTNNITIVAGTGQTINGQALIILNSNNINVLIRIISNTEFACFSTISGHIIQNNGTSLLPQPILDFQGNGVNASNGLGKTIVTIQQGLTQAYTTIQDKGVALPQQNILNFDGDIVTVANGVGKTTVTINKPIIVANTVYVMKNGNDSTGLAERFDKPFLTIQAAINAADAFFVTRNNTNRVLIIVETGNYVDTIILKPYIDFDLQNSYIELTNNDGITDNGVDFGVSPANTFTNIIYGTATLKGQSVGCWLRGVNTKVLINCDSLFGTGGDGIIIQNAYLRIFANKIYTTNTTLNFVQAINPNRLSRCEVFNADIFTLIGSQASTIEFNEGSSFLDCGQLTLTNCRVCCRTNTSSVFKSAINVSGTQPNNFGVLNLSNTLIYSEFGNSICANNTGSLQVYYYGLNNANTIELLIGTGVITSLVSTLQVNPSVIYNNLP